MGPTTEAEEVHYTDLNGCDILPNITYLGKRGLFSPSSGLKIAYLSGLENKGGETDNLSFNQKDVMATKVACIRNQTYRGVDFLLTQQWPKYIGDGGSESIAWLAAHIRPRYHFTNGKEFVERPPFRNETIDNDVAVATRFISLSEVGDQKWIYAINVAPVEKIRMTELCQRTTDETKSPYPNSLLQADVAGIHTGQKQFFYDLDAPAEKRRKKREPRPEFDQSKCWFCLGSPNVEKHLVISIGTECYLALAKGGLNPEHLIITSVKHHQALVGLPDSCAKEVKQFIDALKAYFESKDEVPVIFERNYKTSHLQIQVVPIPKLVANTQKLYDLFMDDGTSHGINLEKLEKGKSLNDVISVGVPYFMVELPDGTVLYSKIRQQFPLQFGRLVLADESVLDMPDRIEWQNCKMNETEETAITQKFRKAFQPFDFTL